MSFDLKILRGRLVVENGDVKPIFDNEKLVQDVIKILLTEEGDNSFHPGYGSRIGALKLGHVGDEDLLVSDLSSSAERAIRKLISIQRAQSRRQFLSPGETIIDINNISVSRNDLDPRSYTIFISVLTQELTVVNESINIRVV
jgi:hypothetical protein